MLSLSGQICGNLHEHREGLWMDKAEKCCPENNVVIRYFDDLLKINRKSPEIRFYKEKWKIEEQRLKAKIVTRK